MFTICILTHITIILFLGVMLRLLSSSRRQNGTEGMNYMPQITMNQREKAYALLKADADKILRLIEVQIENLMTPQCPLYEDVLDTQMFGLSREIDFAVRLDLITEEEGRKLIENLEHKLTILHETAQNTVQFKNNL